jgi:hypothetical protein
MHAPMQCFQNVLAYFSLAFNYERKIFMKLTLANVTKIYGCYLRMLVIS